MIKYAYDSLKPQIKRVWKECFHDEDDYIDFFFTEFFHEHSTLVYIEDGIVVSMLTLMPAKLHVHTECMDIFYIYAVATLPDYQGKGYSSKLLEYVNKEKNYATFLEPATKNLEVFYEKNGYYKSIKKDSLILDSKDIIKERVNLVNSFGKPNSNKKQVINQQDDLVKIASITQDESTMFKVQELTANEASIYVKLRNASMNDQPYIEWSNTMIAYAIKENAFSGGKTVLVNDQFLVMYREFEGVLYIREHTMPDDLILEFTKYLIEQNKIVKQNLNKQEQTDQKQTDQKRLNESFKSHITLNTNTKLRPNNEQVIMTRFAIDENNVYFNLAFE